MLVRKSAQLPLLLVVVCLFAGFFSVLAGQTWVMAAVNPVLPPIQPRPDPVLPPLVDNLVAPATDFAYTVANGKVTITKYKGAGGNVVIPGKIDGYPVTAIGTMAFLFKDSVTGVVIPEGVTEIGDDAFSACSNLASVTLPNSLLKISGCAFDACPALSSITFPANLTNIGAFAFAGTGLTHVAIPKTITSIGDSAFSSCPKLAAFDVAAENPAYASQDGVLYNKAKTLLIQYPPMKTAPTFTVPAGVTRIKNQAFASNSYLTGVTLPASLTGIGHSAFVLCKALQSVVIPVNVASVEDRAFRYCQALSSVTFQGAQTAIGSSAFGGCTSLTNITLPGGLKTIGMYTFEQCYGLKNINIPSTVTSIKEGAFQDCINLTGIQLPAGLTAIERFTFWGCKNLNSITLPGGVTSIGNLAFGGTNLTSVSIPAGVTVLGLGIFKDCASLTDARFYGDAPKVMYENYGYAKCQWFQGCAPGFKIRYLSGKAGWSTPTWYGYPPQPSPPVWSGYPAQPFTSPADLPSVAVNPFARLPIPALVPDEASLNPGKLNPQLPPVPIRPVDESIVTIPGLDLIPIPLPLPTPGPLPVPEPIIPEPITPEPDTQEPITPGPVTPEPTPGPAPDTTPGPVEEHVVIQLYLGKAESLVNGQSQPMDAQPVLRDGRLLLPVRYVAQPLGATTAWDEKTQKATVTLGDIVIELWIGNPVARVNGGEKMIDPNNPKVTPIIVSGRTMLPFRFIGECLGCSVEWNDTLKEAKLTSGQ